jgi:hypothetical protein
MGGTLGETGVRLGGFRFPPISPNLITLFYFFFTFLFIQHEKVPLIFFV